MSKIRTTEISKLIQTNSKNVIVNVPKNSSLQDILELLPTADKEASKSKTKPLIISGLGKVFEKEKIKTRKDILGQLCKLESNFEFSDGFPVDKNDITGYCHVVNALSISKNDKEKYSFHYQKDESPKDYRRKRAAYARQQKAGFDPNNIIARKIIVEGRADGKTSGEINQLFGEKQLTSTRGKAYSNTAMSRLWQDFFKIRRRFDESVLGERIEEKIPELAFNVPNNQIKTNNNIPNPINLSEMKHPLEDKVYAEEIIDFLFTENFKEPVYFDFIHEGEIIDSLIIRPEAVKGDKISLDVVEQTVLFPGLYFVRPYLLKKGDNINGKSDKEIPLPSFILSLGKKMVELDGIKIINHEDISKIKAFRSTESSVIMLD